VALAVEHDVLKDLPGPGSIDDVDTVTDQERHGDGIGRGGAEEAATPSDGGNAGRRGAYKSATKHGWLLMKASI
jgi:hypothetical protein